jgi:hypothetical protein
MKKKDSDKSTIIFEDFQELEGFTLTMEPMSESEFYYLVDNHFLQHQEAFLFGNFK